MKIDFISDLHIDHHINPSSNEVKINKFISHLLPEEPADILIIAGDLGHYNEQNIKFLKALKKFYNLILYTAGNHELYLTSKKQQEKYHWNSFNRLSELQNMIAEIEGIEYMNGQTVDIDGFTISGFPGWYDIGKDFECWKNYSNDPRAILEGYPIVLPYSSERHITFETDDYFQLQLEILKNISFVDLLFSHVPMIEIPDYIIKNDYIEDEGNKFYFQQKGGIDLIKGRCKNYIFGHIHDMYDFTLNGIDIFCNPFGYPSESRGKNKKIVGIDF